MAQVGSATTSKALSILTAPTGLPFSVMTISEREKVKLAEISPAQVFGQNIAFDLAERSVGVSYPVVYVYCEKIANLLREKFRTFSGRAHMIVEVRVSQDRLEGLERQMQLYVEAVTEVLDAHRGDWGQGMFYTGGYEVSFGPVKHGGRNLIQAAKLEFEVEVSMN